MRYFPDDFNIRECFVASTLQVYIVWPFKDVFYLVKTSIGRKSGILTLQSCPGLARHLLMMQMYDLVVSSRGNWLGSSHTKSRIFS